MNEDIQEKQARTWGMLCHLSAIVGYLVLPLGHIIGPLVVWLIKKDEHPFVDQQGKESLNFQLSMTLYFLVACVLLLLLIGFILVPVIYLTGLVLTIIASVRANEGTPYRYPLTIRFL
ncbi:DUF4870 domain-containing protein [Salinithrix halophila]|uniref:DUF4870 domain-containing protein n=1 Tax=Salinithrix halophila TaxID=1485204 RepID=A0ABV8JNC2_9BACL